jgi:uncharacterized phage protein (TIGR02218 family)
MKALASTYTTGNAGTIQTIAHCWRVIRQDGEILGFTDFEHDLTFAGLTYISAEGFAPTDVDSNFSGSGQVSISSFFGDQVTRPELDGGIFEDATVEFIRVNWASLPTDLDAIPRQYDLLVRGRVGITNYGDRRYTLQFRGLADDLKARNGWQCQKDCRYQFGDQFCKKELTYVSKTVTGSNGDRLQFTVADSFADNRFTGSTVEWLTGDNAGYVGNVIYSNGSTFRLASPTPYNIEAGDSFETYENCLKTEEDCQNRWGNILNYGGEGIIPGQSGFAQWGTTN